MGLELWHCKGARSLRVLWALEELGLEYTLHVLPFPPRFQTPNYLDINPLGTVPFFRDGNVGMTESCAICHYLAVRHSEGRLAIPEAHAEFGPFLNWLHHADATLTFPQTLVLRYGRFEPEERRQPQIVEDYSRWFLARLKLLDAHLHGRDYLCDSRFTVADIAVGYAVHLGAVLGLGEQFSPRIKSYLARLTEREAFVRASAK